MNNMKSEKKILKIITAYGDTFTVRTKLNGSMTDAIGVKKIASFLINECSIIPFNKTLEQCIEELNSIQEEGRCPNAGKDFYFLEN